MRLWRKQIRLLTLLLGLTWAAIAVFGLLLWSHRQSAHPESVHLEPAHPESANPAAGPESNEPESAPPESTDPEPANSESALPAEGPEESQLAKLSEAAARFESKAAALEAKVAELEGIRELQRYGTEAIAEGRRSALYRLDEYHKNPTIPALKETANAELIRVETYYLTTRRFRGFPDELPAIDETDPVASLSGILLDGERDWALRAEAARRLGELGKNALAADALAEASHTDPSLYVVQESILAFSRVTGFRSSGVFDSESVQDWWAENRSGFE